MATLQAWFYVVLVTAYQLVTYPARLARRRAGGD